MALKDKYFTISEAAEELKVTRQTISRWITQGNIPSEKVGREILIKKKDLYQYRFKRLSEVVADRILDLYIAAAEDYSREKGYINANTPTWHVEFVDEHTDADGIVHRFSDEDKTEIDNRIRPILEEYLRGFYQKIRKVSPPKSKRGGKTTK